MPANARTALRLGFASLGGREPACRERAEDHTRVERRPGGLSAILPRMLPATVLRRVLPIALLAMPPLASIPVASGFSRKAVAVVDPLSASRSLPPEGG